jgi:hypothetical protein
MIQTLAGGLHDAALQPFVGGALLAAAAAVVGSTAHRTRASCRLAGRITDSVGITFIGATMASDIVRVYCVVVL